MGQVAPPAPRTTDVSPLVRLRGLELNPTIAVTNAGIDSNVFNSVENPQRDFTATLSPAVNSWARVGRARIAARGQTDLHYFGRFSSQRSVDGGVGARAEFPVNRVVPWVESGVVSGRQRMGYEIDARARRTQRDIGLGLDVRVAPKTTVGVGLRRSVTAWDKEATFLGNNLSAGLDRTSDAATLAYRQQLTALTTFVFDATAATDRFDVQRERDTDSISLLTGFDLKARALISGSVRVGFKKIDPVGGAFEPFRGLVTRATVGYSVRATHLDLEVGRESNFSYDVQYPFYLQTGATATVTQRVSSVWDIQGRVGRQDLAYRTLRGSLVDLLQDRTDRTDQRGGGVGYRFRRTTRIGVNLEWTRRSSPLQFRDYQAFRVGVSVSYVG